MKKEKHVEIEKAWKAVYCDPKFQDEVHEELIALWERLKSEHPEYLFDLDLGWDSSDEDHDE